MSAHAIGDRELHYEVTGQGMDVVFIHSLGTDLHLWDSVVDRLSGVRAIRYDLPGHGFSTVSPGNLDTHVSDVSKLIDAVASEGAVVVGASVGGLIAQRLAVQYPEQVRALVLSSTGLRIGSAIDWNARVATIEASGFSTLTTAIVERWFSSTWRIQNPTELEQWRLGVSQLEPDGYIDLCRILADTDLTGISNRITTRCLCIGGTADPSIPPEVLHALADAISKAELYLMDGAGHLPMVEAPEHFSVVLTEFLRGFMS